MPAYFSFDFEAPGANYATNGVNGLGIVVFDEDGNELECYETGIVLTNGRQFEPGCKTHFWDKQPEALKWINDNCETPWVVVSKIVDLYQRYKKSHGKVEWIAWPAAYDWGLMVNFYNEFKTEDAPNIGYSATCISSMMKALQIAAKLDEKPTLESLGCPIEKPHFPGSDARAQGRAFFAAKKQLAEIKN